MSCLVAVRPGGHSLPLLFATLLGGCCATTAEEGQRRLLDEPTQQEIDIYDQDAEAGAIVLIGFLEYDCWWNLDPQGEEIRIWGIRRGTRSWDGLGPGGVRPPIPADADLRIRNRFVIDWAREAHPDGWSR